MKKQKKIEGYRQKIDEYQIGQKNVVSTNLVIIKEIFNIINNSKKVSNDDFYVKLLGIKDKKNHASDRYESLIDQRVKVSKYKNQFEEKGFSANFFTDDSASFIIAPQCCIEYIKSYVLDRRLNEVKQLREQYIFPYIFEYKNEDGTLIIDCVKKIIDEIRYEKTKSINNDTVNDVVNYVTNLSCSTALSQKNIKKFYNELGKSYNKDKGTIEYVTLSKSENVNNHKLYVTSDNNRIKQTLLLIRETYALLAELDNNNNAMKNFYKLLGCSANEYDDYIRYGNIPTRKLARIFQIFKFPASSFRGDSPCEIDITTLGCQLNDNVDIDDADAVKKFRNALRLNLFYVIDKRNIPFFMAVYSMYSSPFEEIFNMVNLELAKENSFPQN